AADREARTTLQSQRVTEEHQTDVNLRTRTAIAAMKDSLAGYIAATAQCAASDDPKQLLAVLSQPFQGGPSPDSGYGSTLSFEVPKSSRDLIAVTASFGIECGEDTMLVVLSRAADGWRPALRVQSPLYASIADAFWSFDFEISPPDAAGNWFVVEKSIAP